MQTIICWQRYYKYIYSTKITYHEESVQWRRLVQVALKHHIVAAGCTKTQGGADWRGERHRVSIAEVKMWAQPQRSTPLMLCFTFESWNSPRSHCTAVPTTSNPSGARDGVAISSVSFPHYTKRWERTWAHMYVQASNRIFAGKSGKWTLLCPNRELIALWCPNTSDNTSV